VREPARYSLDPGYGVAAKSWTDVSAEAIG